MEHLSHTIKLHGYSSGRLVWPGSKSKGKAQTGKGCSAVVHSREIRNAELCNVHHIPQKPPWGTWWSHMDTSKISLVFTPHPCPGQSGSRAGFVASGNEVLSWLWVCVVPMDRRDKEEFPEGFFCQSCFFLSRSATTKMSLCKVRGWHLPQL